MKLSLYLDEATSLHRLHPVAKVWAGFCLFVAAFSAERPIQSLSLAAIVLGLLWLGRAVPNVWRFRWFLALVFFMTSVVWTLFFNSQQPWFSWGPLHPGPDGVAFALAMGCKLTTFFLCGLLFLSTTRVEEFADALRMVGVPEKLGFTFTLAFRLVPVFVDSALSAVQAQRCRGFDFDQGGWVRRVRRYVPIIVPVFVGALRRADLMAMALEARGVQRRGPRTSFRVYSFGWQELVAIFLGVALVACTLWLRAAGRG